jgi:hypothetical protein
MTKAIDSLRHASEAFNSYQEEGRVTAVLLHLQHSFEMLLKAALVQRRIQVFELELGRSVGFEKCVNLGRDNLRLTEEEAGTLRAVDALRDQEQHWIASMSEGLLYVYVRAAVSLFDALLGRWFGQKLVDHLPLRVLPISADPPRDIQLLIDDEYSQIKALLQPGRRKRADAQARIRSLLAIEAHTSDGVVVSNRDVARVEKGVKAGKPREEVFPRLAELQSEVAGTGLALTVRFTKATGMPVRLVSADAPEEAAAVREVDLQRKYHWSKPELARKLDMTLPRCYALRLHLGIENDDDCRHDFVFGSTVHRQYSDNALTRLKTAIDTLDLESVWAEYRRKTDA